MFNTSVVVAAVSVDEVVAETFCSDITYQLRVHVQYGIPVKYDEISLHHYVLDLCNSLCLIVRLSIPLLLSEYVPSVL